jgi:hypothetical protein
LKIFIETEPGGNEVSPNLCAIADHLDRPNRRKVLDKLRTSETDGTDVVRGEKENLRA